MRLYQHIGQTFISLCLVCTVLRIEPRALYLLGKHLTQTYIQLPNILIDKHIYIL